MPRETSSGADGGRSLPATRIFGLTSNFDGAFLFDSGVCSRALPSLVAWQRRVSPDLMSSPNHLLFTQATLRTLRTPCIMLSVGTIGPVGKMDPVAWTEHPAYTREILRSRTERVRPLDMALCVCSIFAGISPAVRVTLYSGQDIVNSASQNLCHYQSLSMSFIAYGSG